MDETHELDKEYKLKFVAVKLLVNLYVIERVVLGYEKPGDKAPVDLYIKQLGLEQLCDEFIRSSISGFYIDKQEYISTEYDYDEYVRMFFVGQMERIFKDQPKDEFLENEYEDMPFLPSLRKYLFGLLPLFTEVLKTPPDPFLVELLLTRKKPRAEQLEKRRKFVTDVMLKPLEAGSVINEYVDGLYFPPFYVGRLIDIKSDNCRLMNVDVENYKYIFALFSLMKFMNAENFKIFEIKMFEWEQQNNREGLHDKSLDAILQSLRAKYTGK